ncbi:unnamed protein product [Adineta ricciae]|uniref:Peptidase S1 domain-containing protein n=1 Tax=Adineta ricciae TaxID=249248 RepID=A0A814CA09_ADIRI|nr:unnamed protein product [Adineta ricciae]CAF0940414.1 unnamed protein product [Adineta ricciae]
MYTLLILLAFFPLIHSQCNYTSDWFNENHPWEPNSNGNDIERFSLIRARYPWIFELTPWTGLFEIRRASHQQMTNGTISIANYTSIRDGFICHAVDGQQCVDYEIRFCLQYNEYSISTYPPVENQTAGGSEVHPHALPWHVSIQYDERHMCGGTLIDNQHILTTASCFQQLLVHLPYSVVLGVHRLSNVTQRVPIDRFIFHSDYNSVTSQNDIGVIRLRQRIDSFSDRIRPAWLARSSRPIVKAKPLIVAGWRTVGNNTWSVTETDELRQTVLNIKDECSTVYPTYSTSKQLCVGTEHSRRDLCQGDIGSGLFDKQKYDVDRWILVGIVSYGCEFAHEGYPGAYVRISAYYDWIRKTVEKMNTEK